VSCVLDSDVMFSKTDIHSGIYHLVACDLRDTATLSAKLDASGVDRQLPTVFIAECVLVYMSAESSSALTKWISEQFNTALFVSYEQASLAIVDSTELFICIFLTNFDLIFDKFCLHCFVAWVYRLE